MQKPIITCAVAMFFAAVSSFGAGAARMTIRSPAFHQGGDIPSKFTCDGGDMSPPLEISDVPPEAKSLILIVDDPDAPSGLFTHWLIWNIPPQTHSVVEGSAPQGAEGTNDFGKSGYGSPCPPSGAHRYYFKVFALDRKLTLSPGARRRPLEAAMKGHIIAQGELMGHYARRK
ncbi:MAG TPA: YbhB/YbcL family Raf kinase inhibitor-like protein [Candidatus Udaeobacter sp.]|jgi:hypothetical protein|nr:YbhB/YbcL family Raf kinase inhibitor-like protein [Candidatus Udaeobacter sp.]